MDGKILADIAYCSRPERLFTVTCLKILRSRSIRVTGIASEASVSNGARMA
jgi:hypothetical protein